MRCNETTSQGSKLVYLFDEKEDEIVEEDECDDREERGEKEEKVWREGKEWLHKGRQDLGLLGTVTLASESRSRSRASPLPLTQPGRGKCLPSPRLGMRADRVTMIPPAMLAACRSLWYPIRLSTAALH